MDPTTPEAEPEPVTRGLLPLIVHPLRLAAPHMALVNGGWQAVQPVTAGQVRAAARPGRVVFEELLAAITAEARVDQQAPLGEVYALTDGRIALPGQEPAVLELLALVELDRALAEALGLETLGLPALVQHPALVKVGMMLLNEAANAVAPAATITIRTRSLPAGRVAYGPDQGLVSTADVEVLLELFAELPYVSSYYTRDELLVEVWSAHALQPTTAAGNEWLVAGLRVEIGAGSGFMATVIVRNNAGSVYALGPGKQILDPRVQLPQLVENLPAVLQRFVQRWDIAAVRPLDEVVGLDEPGITEVVASLRTAAAAAGAGQAPWTAVHPHAIELLDGVHRWIAAHMGEESCEAVMLGLHLDDRNASGARVGRPTPTVGSLANGVLLWAQQLEPLKAARLERLMGRLIVVERDDAKRPPLYWVAAG